MNIQIKPKPPDISIIAETGSINDQVTYNGTRYKPQRKLKNGCVLILPDGSSSAWMHSHHYHSLSGMTSIWFESLPIEFGDFMILCGGLYRAEGSQTNIEIRE